MASGHNGVTAPAGVTSRPCWIVQAPCPRRLAAPPAPRAGRRRRGMGRSRTCARKQYVVRAGRSDRMRVAGEADLLLSPANGTQFRIDRISDRLSSAARRPGLASNRPPTPGNTCRPRHDVFGDGPADIRFLVAGTCLLGPARGSRTADGQNLQDRIARSVYRTDTREPDRPGSASYGLARSGLGRREELLNRSPLGRRESAAPARTRRRTQGAPGGADPCIRHEYHPRGARWCSRVCRSSWSTPETR